MENKYNFNHNIKVSVISPDPYFQLATQALIGRDRFSRISQVVSSFNNLEVHSNEYHSIVIDFGYLGIANFPFRKLISIKSQSPQLKVIGFVDNENREIDQLLRDNLFDAILLKHEIGPCTHLVVQFCYKTSKILITKSIEKYVGSSNINDFYIIPSVHQWHQELHELTPRAVEVFVLRVFAGLDNYDIQDELQLSRNTLKTHLRNIFSILGDTGINRSEKVQSAFRELSDFWWAERFLTFFDNTSSHRKF